MRDFQQEWWHIAHTSMVALSRNRLVLQWFRLFVRIVIMYLYLLLMTSSDCPLITRFPPNGLNRIISFLHIIVWVGASDGPGIISSSLHSIIWRPELESTELESEANKGAAGNTSGSLLVLFVALLFGVPELGRSHSQFNHIPIFPILCTMK